MQGGVRVQPFYGHLEGSARVVYAPQGATRCCVGRARAKVDRGEGVVVELRDRVGVRGIHFASRPRRTSPYNGFGQAGGGRVWKMSCSGQGAERSHYTQRADQTNEYPVMGRIRKGY